MNATRVRQAILAVALVGTLAATVWPDGDPEVVEPSRPVPVHGPQPAGADEGAIEHLDMEQMKRRNQSVSDIDPFRAKGWFVPPPTPAPLPPPKPTAPPLPFVYLGRVEGADGSNPMVYLATGSDFFAVKVGEEFAGRYRVETIEKDVLVVTYLPMMAKQQLLIGAEE
jgi:hypothetical protein